MLNISIRVQTVFYNNIDFVSMLAGVASRGTYRSGNGSLAVIDREVTGGTLGFGGATEPLVIKPLGHEKKIVLVRHGLSIWNEEGRVQVHWMRGIRSLMVDVPAELEHFQIYVYAPQIFCQRLSSVLATLNDRTGYSHPYIGVWERDFA